jgi:hypothetical protein
MIVTPEFVRHWKTELLVKITKDKAAPLAVLNGWSYCQVSREWRFPNMTPFELAGVCRWGDMTPPCDEALLASGFIERYEKGFSFHGWEKANASLIQKWTCGLNGRRGNKSGRQPAGSGRFPQRTERQADANRLEADVNRLEADAKRLEADAKRKPSDQTRQDKTGLDNMGAPHVNIISTPVDRPGLTKLTPASKASMKGIAVEIARNTHGWAYDNCKVPKADVSAKSIATVLKEFAGRLQEKEIHECWADAVKRTHAACVDGFPIKKVVGYAVECFRERLTEAAGDGTKPGSGSES